jgi:hypothetical protein
MQGHNGGMPSLDHVLAQTATRLARRSQAVVFLYHKKPSQQKNRRDCQRLKIFLIRLIN